MRFLGPLDHRPDDPDSILLSHGPNADGERSGAFLAARWVSADAGAKGHWGLLFVAFRKSRPACGCSCCAHARKTRLLHEGSSVNQTLQSADPVCGFSITTMGSETEATKA
jgi:hypothetical protein